MEFVLFSLVGLFFVLLFVFLGVGGGECVLGGEVPTIPGGCHLRFHFFWGLVKLKCSRGTSKCTDVAVSKGVYP